MKKQNSFVAYVLIGIGVYFLLKQLNIPILSNFYSWPTLLIIIGAALLLNSYSAKDDQNLIGGAIILGLGIHFHGLSNYSFWIDHWTVYPLIIGIALIIRFFRTRQGFFPGVILIVFSSLLIFSIQIPAPLEWIYSITDFLERFWPIAIIIFGIYLLKRK